MKESQKAINKNAAQKEVTEDEHPEISVMKDKSIKTPKKDIRLYNVLFPFWLLMLFPSMWILVIPGNFIIDSIVLLISMKALKIQEKKLFYKKYILKVFSFGLISDIIGSAFMFLMTYISQIGTKGR